MDARSEVSSQKEMKILCLHGFRTSGSFFQKQISRWDPSIFAGFNLVFLDGIFPAGGKSDIESIHPPPYFEWFQFNKEFTEFQNLDKCISFLCEYIDSNGPFDGFLGFSQGAALSALLLAYQAQGKILQQHPPLKVFISISGCKFRDPSICDVAYREPIKARSVHLIGDEDWLRLPSEDLAAAFHDPLVLRHPRGHTVPRLDAVAVQQLTKWTTSILQTPHQSRDVSIADVADNGGVEKANVEDMEAILVKKKETITDIVGNGEVEKGDARESESEANILVRDEQVEDGVTVTEKEQKTKGISLVVAVEQRKLIV